MDFNYVPRVPGAPIYSSLPLEILWEKVWEAWLRAHLKPRIQTIYASHGAYPFGTNIHKGTHHKLPIKHGTVLQQWPHPHELLFLPFCFLTGSLVHLVGYSPTDTQRIYSGKSWPYTSLRGGRHFLKPTSSSGSPDQSVVQGYVRKATGPPRASSDLWQDHKGFYCQSQCAGDPENH